MVLTFSNIVDDLRASRITPSRTNSTYEWDVRSWLWKTIVDQDLPIHCRKLLEFVVNFSFDFTKEAKRIWEITNGTYRDVLKKFSNFMDKTVEFPGTTLNQLFCFIFFKLTY